MQLKDKRILVAPLDWGLGHATRCIPLIKQFLADGNDVILGCTSSTRFILEESFPELPQVTLPDHNILYSTGNGQMLKLALQAPKVFAVMRREQEIVQNICRDFEIDVVLSDNRFGCRAEGVHNIFMTHQVHLKAALFEGILRARFQKIIEGFDELWVPDYKSSPGLAGDLSHGADLNIPTKFIGPLSRLSQQDYRVVPGTVLAVLSGPEPQRFLFEETLLRQMEETDMDCSIIRGSHLPAPKTTIKLNNHLQTEAMAQAIFKSEYIICRSGYSSLMDLEALGRSAILVPTPGQTEQEYLAELHSSSGKHISFKQKDFDLKAAIRLQQALLDRSKLREDTDRNSENATIRH